MRDSPYFDWVAKARFRGTSCSVKEWRVSECGLPESLPLDFGAPPADAAIAQLSSAWKRTGLLTPEDSALAIRETAVLAETLTLWSLNIATSNHEPFRRVLNLMQHLGLLGNTGEHSLFERLSLLRTHANVLKHRAIPRPTPGTALAEYHLRTLRDYAVRLSDFFVRYACPSCDAWVRFPLVLRFFLSPSVAEVPFCTRTPAGCVAFGGRRFWYESIDKDEVPLRQTRSRRFDDEWDEFAFDELDDTNADAGAVAAKDDVVAEDDLAPVAPPAWDDLPKEHGERLWTAMDRIVVDARVRGSERRNLRGWVIDMFEDEEDKEETAS